MYKYKQVRDNMYVLSLDNHVEVSAAIAAFCAEKGILAGNVMGLGAVSEATFRFLDPNTLKYVDKTFTEQMEITNLTGNISQKDGKPYLHLHATLCDANMQTHGGHVNELRISATCEMVLRLLPGQVGRKLDDVTGLNVFDF